MRAATRGFSAVARMARPSRVELTSHIRTARDTAVTPRIMIWVGVMTAPTDVDRRAGQEGGVSLVVGLPDDHGQGLQQDAHADRRDQRGQLGAVAQGPVGDFFNGEVERRRHHTGDQRCQDQDQPARCAGHAVLHDADGGPAGEGPDHEHLAMREVDQIDDAVDHGVTQGHQGIHAAQNQTVDDLLKQDFHTFFSVSASSCLALFRLAYQTRMPCGPSGFWLAKYPPAHGSGG